MFAPEPENGGFREPEVTNDVDDWNVCDLQSAFCTTVGGLRPQVDEIVRRVLDGRVIRRTLDDSSSSALAVLDRVRREEMRGLLELGLHPIKGTRFSKACYVGPVVSFSSTHFACLF